MIARKRSAARRFRERSGGPTSSARSASNQFTRLRARESLIAAEVAKLSIEELLRTPNGRFRPLLSANAKTGVSLDFPIGYTCRPTQLCADTCYGSRPGAPTAWDKSLRSRHRNLRYVRLEETSRVIHRLARAFRNAQRARARRGIELDFLRFCGIGDLFPELVAVINAFAVANPDILVWVVTRRFDHAANIAELPNIYIELSVDSSTPAALLERARRLVQSHARTYLAFLRTSPTDDTLGAAIVFNQKKTPGLPYDRTTGCPVDAGKLPLGNVRGVGGTACSKCRKCFSSEVLRRQRRMLDSVRAPDRKRHLHVLDAGGIAQ